MGEDELIAECAAKLRLHQRVELGSGDDCAVLQHPDLRSVISVDMLVENQHFQRKWSTPWEVGARAAKQNLADVAAMGAAQHSAVVGIAVPKYVGARELTELSAGLSQTLEASGSALVGGDLTRGDQLVLAVTIVGDLQGREPLLRTGARPEDFVIFAGQAGWSAAGLELYLQFGQKEDCEIDRDRAISEVDSGACANRQKQLERRIISQLPRDLQPLAERAVQAYKVPSPPLELAEIAGKQANSMIDLSDGMERDGRKIALGSGMALVLDPSSIQNLAEPLTPLADYLRKDVQEWVLGGGEDHGLFGTCDAENVETLQRAGFAVLGRVKEGLMPGLYLGQKPVGGRGWDHFG